MAQALRVLHLEDDEDDAELIQAVLRGDGIDCVVSLARSREEYVAALEPCLFDLILLDYSIPGYDGWSALRLAREKCPGVPIIFVSGVLGPGSGKQASSETSADYVQKNNLKHLAPAVREILENTKKNRVDFAGHGPVISTAHT